MFLSGGGGISQSLPPLFSSVELRFRLEYYFCCYLLNPAFISNSDAVNDRRLADMREQLADT